MNNKIKTLLMIASVSTITMIAWAVEHHKKAIPVAKKVTRPETVSGPVYDTVLLRKFQTMAHQLDFNKAICSYEGTINIVDNKDTTNTTRGIDFSFCRVKKDYYYRLGNTETIHRDGLNIFIANDQHKVVISDKEIAIKSPGIDIAGMQKKLADEKYELTGKAQGSEKTLSLLNPRHITCKELSLTYDTTSNKLERIYTRLSDFDDPLNKNKDRTIEILLHAITDKGNMNRYPSVNSIVRPSHGKLELTGKYTNYELITL